MSAYGFITEGHERFSDHYYDTSWKRLIFYINHDFKLEREVWKRLHDEGIIWLYQRPGPATTKAKNWPGPGLPWSPCPLQGTGYSGTLETLWSFPRVQTKLQALQEFRGNTWTKDKTLSRWQMAKEGSEVLQYTAVSPGGDSWGQGFLTEWGDEWWIPQFLVKTLFQPKSFLIHREEPGFTETYRSGLNSRSSLQLWNLEGIT